MLEGIQRAPVASGTGPSGWRYEYAKACAETETGQSAMETILLRVAHGKFGVRRAVTDGNMHLVSAARLVALKRGETKVRPVAVGVTHAVWMKLLRDDTICMY